MNYVRFQNKKNIFSIRKFTFGVSSA
ncbi:YSIRK-type signal peptide-containing protein, partial [Staphylococcus felis]